TMKQTALAMAIVFTVSGCAFAAPAHGKMNRQGVGSAVHKIQQKTGTRHADSYNAGRSKTVIVSKVAAKPKVVHHTNTVYVHDAPRVVHDYGRYCDDRCCSSDNTGTAIAAGLIGLVIGSVISNSSGSI
ncbi:MAG: hypothetical protein Q4E34_05245, partial [Synergistaceae bacterium]|nr:hypothetical protein [Synergistaceae bacterium]